MNDELKSRREMLLASGALAASAALSGGLAHGEDVPELKYEFLGMADAELETAQAVGKVPQGTRRIVYVKGGVVTGPKFNGKILPGGGDWLLVRPDGISEVDVRATIQMDDGALVYTWYRGVIDGKTGYFRTTPRYETSSEKYAWLNNIVAVGVGQGTATGVRYHIYQIL